MFRRGYGTFSGAESLLAARELKMNMNEIMDDFNHNQDNLPILTEIVRHAAITPGRINRGVVNMRLAVIEPDANGYDPYNSAPPVPVEKDSIE